MPTPVIRNRAIPGDQQRDPSSIDAITYNEKAGARKVAEVGRALIPLGDGAGGFTTDASTRRILPSPGKNLAIYNNSGTVQAVSVGDVTVLANAPGVVQISGTNQFVGVPVMPNGWLYLAAAQWSYVITTSATLLVFLIDDPTFIQMQPATNAST